MLEAFREGARGAEGAAVDVAGEAAGEDLGFEVGELEEYDFMAAAAEFCGEAGEGMDVAGIGEAKDADAGHVF